jgi:hypothetical protein
MSLSSPPPPPSRRSADVAQFMLASSFLVLIGLTLPVRGTFALLPFAFTGVTNAAIAPMFVWLPVVASIGALSSIMAFFQRQRAWGTLSIGCGLYVLWVGDRCMRMYAWDQPVQLGGFALFAGSLFLVGASIVYTLRPGIRPTHVSFFGTTIRWQQCRILAGLCYIGAIVAYQQQLPQIGSWLVLVGMGCGLTALLLRFQKT